MRARRLGKALFLSSLACGAWLGCNQILGNESADFDPDAAARFDATTNGDGTTTTDGNAIDGNTLDGTTSTDGGSDALVDGPLGDADDAGPCVNLATNPRHCGACNHDCRGGGCADGGCLPFVLATDVPGPQTLAIDDTHLYWINETTSSLWSVQLDGGNKTRLYEGPDSGAGPGTSLAVQGGNIYFASTADLDAGVLRCATPACDGGVQTEIANRDVPVAVFVSATGTLLFAQTVPSGSVEKCQLPCTVGTSVVASGSSQQFPNNVALTPDGTVLWTTSNPFPGRLQAQPPVGGPVTLASGTISAVTPAFDEVYYVLQGSGPRVVPFDGGSPRVLYDGNSDSRHLAVDTTNVYFTERVKNRVLACNRVNGCNDAGIPVAVQQTSPQGIVVTPTFIYWANEGNAGTGGQIMRLAR